MTTSEIVMVFSYFINLQINGVRVIENRIHQFKTTYYVNKVFLVICYLFDLEVKIASYFDVMV